MPRLQIDTRTQQMITEEHTPDIGKVPEQQKGYFKSYSFNNKPPPSLESGDTTMCFHNERILLFVIQVLFFFISPSVKSTTITIHKQSQFSSIRPNKTKQSEENKPQTVSCPSLEVAHHQRHCRNSSSPVLSVPLYVAYRL